MGCLFFQPGPIHNFNDALKCDTLNFTRYFGKLLDAGIYLAPSQYEAMFISAAHSEEDLASTADTMQKVLLEIFNQKV